MLKPQRNTKKAARARQMISSIFHIPMKDVRDDRAGVEAIYEKLEELGFEWVADEQEWLNAHVVNPKEVQVFSFIVGSPTHSIEEAASIMVDALEKQGYTIARTDLILDINHPAENLVRIEVIK